MKMTWQQLLVAKSIQPHTTGKSEIGNLRAVVDRDLKDAALTGLSTDRRFATAYNAALQLAQMVIACAGYRVTARSGHHKTSFEALELAMGPKVSELASYFDTCRRKRNIVDYDIAYTVSETEAEELLQKAGEFRELVEKWIIQNYPKFAL
jgi:uncharacterized protein (UPF0332 family)